MTVVTKILIVNNLGAAQSYKIGETNGFVNDSATKAAVRDQRRSTATTILGLRAQAADALASLPVITVPAGNQFALDVVWPLVDLTPFGGIARLNVQSGVVAQEVSAYFWGYERALRPEEIVID